MSLPEVLLWQQIRGGRLGSKFRRQHPVGPYVTDFACPASSLIVEIDGDAHNRAPRPANDVSRDRFLAENGWRVLHIPAARILEELEAVLTAIRAHAELPLHRPADGPPPRAGEELK